jgi:hypothetical protein
MFPRNLLPTAPSAFSVTPAAKSVTPNGRGSARGARRLHPGALHGVAALAVAAALASGSAAAAMLEAEYELNSPIAISEVEGETRTSDGTPASISRTLKDTSAADSEPNWRISASASSTNTTQKARATWSDNGTYGSTVSHAAASVEDRFTIGGDGDGILRMTWDLSGSIRANNVRPEFRDDLSDVLDFGIDFFAELSRGFSRTRVSEQVELSNGEGPEWSSGIFFYGWFEAFAGGTQAILERAVTAGDVLDYDLLVQARIDTQKAIGSATADFGTTAELSSVFLSDGLSLSAESGFDYLSVNDSDSGGGDSPVQVPVPAGYALFAIGLAGIGVFGRGRRRADFRDRIR